MGSKKGINMKVLNDFKKLIRRISIALLILIGIILFAYSFIYQSPSQNISAWQQGQAPEAK
jgi:hypothetical protein